jgi:hypothetical protein
MTIEQLLQLTYQKSRKKNLQREQIANVHVVLTIYMMMLHKCIKDQQ